MNVFGRLSVNFGRRKISSQTNFILKHKECTNTIVVNRAQVIFGRNFGKGFSSDATSSTNEGFQDPYKVLKLDPRATAREVRNAYINLSKEFHPDNNPADEHAKEQFILINNAYRKIMEVLETVKDEERDAMDDEVCKPYDFTISPIGIETEEIPNQMSSEWSTFKKYVIFIFTVFICIQIFKEPTLNLLTSYYNERHGPSREDVRREMKEKYRKAIIERRQEEKENIKMMQSSQPQRPDTNR